MFFVNCDSLPSRDTKNELYGQILIKKNILMGSEYTYFIY